MAKRILNEAITLVRNGAHVRLKPGDEFDFTAAEIAEIEGTDSNPGVRPQALSRKTRVVADEETGSKAKPAPKTKSADDDKL